MPAGTVVTNLDDAIALVVEVFESARHEINFLFPPSMLSVAGTYDTVESAKQFMQAVER